jgi:small subunit ribosomal protein S16
MVKIRLRRVGAKKAPYYRVVVADSRFSRDGRFIEEIGLYDPSAEANKLTVDMDRVKYWIANGAQPTDTVRAFSKRSRANKEILPA